ncbi:hypothetical protein [Herbaspirillum sp.]|uniref:hypothetical protein n=1 Tax=Herbaspirillum sp. TaxID=1890675 RepID=UPI0031D23A6C
MNIRELEQRLHQEGCNGANYAIGERGTASDAFCLTNNGTQWMVYYTERGQDTAPIYASGSEHQACEFFFAHIMAMRHDHCVGFYKNKGNAEALMDRLNVLNIDAWLDEIPFGGPSDPRFRVFVRGKAIFEVRDTLGVSRLED